MNAFLKGTLFLATLVIASATIGQDINDLKSVDVDKLSDQQVQTFVNRAESSGLTMQQLELLAKQRGMSSSQISKLRLF